MDAMVHRHIEPNLGLLEHNLLRRLGFLSPGVARTRPVYRHFARLLERGIKTGELPTGTRLPAERDLATRLKVSRATVVHTYRELESRGLVRRYVGRGTFIAAAPEVSGAPFAWRGKVASTALRVTDSVIRDIVASSVDPKLLAVAAGMPALECFPIAAFRRSLERVLSRDLRAVWGHAETLGSPGLRESIAKRFGSRPEMVLVLAGAQQGLDLLSRCLIDVGDTVVVDRPGYLGAIHTFRAAGARLVGWDVVRHDLDELEDLLIRYRPKLIYTNPTFQNPTGWTMPIKLRREFLALVGRHRVPVIEDDTYRELSLGPEPPPSLQALDSQSIVIYLSTFSKVLGPGLRLGWISAAESIVDQLAQIKQRADPHTQTLVQLVVKDLIDEGAFDRHLTDLRVEHRHRRDAVLEGFKRHAAGVLQWTVPAGGLYVWSRLLPKVDAAAVLERTLPHAVAFAKGDVFYVDPAGERELRLCFASIVPSRAGDVAQRLARAIASLTSRTKPASLLTAV